MVAFATFLGSGRPDSDEIRHGAIRLDHPGFMGILTDIPLIAGYGLYGVMTVLIVIAFKDGELSVLYPVISLSYVWVTALSYFVFHDNLNPYKFAGLTLSSPASPSLAGGRRHDVHAAFVHSSWCFSDRSSALSAWCF